MIIFLAGATGAVGRRVCVLLMDAGHQVVGTTRSPDKASLLRALGVAPIVVDFLDADAAADAMRTVRPDIVVHQLTDLASPPGTPGYAATQEANRRLRIDGTRNLMRAARTTGVSRVVAQSIAFIYAPGEGMRDEDDPLDIAAEGVRQLTVQGVVALEREVLQKSDVAGVVLRYGYFYGPGSWYDAAPKPPSIHVDAAAHAALLAVSNGVGVYNIAENDGAVSNAKAVRELGFDPAFRLSKKLNQALSIFRSASSR
ncbi:MAG TPA: NAD(P)-dependent oxidoreductase [Bradyrhizobium sp.]|nr:NAD(P)-dependent oxidoreductase [Bradyrhizobium sp.]